VVAPEAVGGGVGGGTRTGEGGKVVASEREAGGEDALRECVALCRRNTSGLDVVRESGMRSRLRQSMASAFGGGHPMVERPRGVEMSRL